MCVFCFSCSLLRLYLTRTWRQQIAQCVLSMSFLSAFTGSTQMFPAVGSPHRCQATFELQLCVSSSSAQEDSPLPHPAILWRRDAPQLEFSAEEEEDSEEECVRNLLAVFLLVSAAGSPPAEQGEWNAKQQIWVRSEIIVKYLISVHRSLHYSCNTISTLERKGPHNYHWAHMLRFGFILRAGCDCCNISFWNRLALVMVVIEQFFRLWHNSRDKVL